MTIILTVLLSLAGHATESWFCTTQASKAYSNRVEACGVGTGETEARARLDAFDQAALEFARVSPTQAGDPTPMRTECEPAKSGFICRRMVSFQFGAVKAPKAATGKIKVGMPKSDALAILGQPESMAKHPSLGGAAPSVQLFYSRPCSYMSCYIVIENDLVRTIEGVKPEFQEI